MKTSGHFVSIAILVVTAICCYCTYALESRTSPQASPRQGRLQKQPPKTDPSCGSSDDLAQRVAVCARPLMDLLQGTVKKWPRTEDDAMELCDSFGWSERCIRDSSRKCGKGIQKTIISTLAASIARTRKRECSRAKAPGIVRTTMCLEQEQNVIQDWMKNVTGKSTIIERDFLEGDKKINGICCIVNDIEKELKQMLSPKCNEESKFIVRLYRSVLEDAIELICRNPRCNNYLRGHKPVRAAQAEEMIAVILRIVFSLDSNEN